MNFRELIEKDLAISLEGEWSLPVNLISPDGIRYDGLRGQVLFDIVRVNPETGEEMTVSTPVVSLRRSSMTRVPLPGENWGVEIPSSPNETATMVLHVISPTRPPEGGASIGFIRLYLQTVEQSS